MTGKTLEVENLLSKENMAEDIYIMYDRFNGQRKPWLAEKLELRNYIFATDTRSTSGESQNWKNSTTIPKICQIRDNLHANYMAALFPNDEWLKWEGYDLASDTTKKAASIEQYMKNKLRQGDFKRVISQLIYDYIDYGNAFSDVEYVSEVDENEQGEGVTKYVGPRATRISPTDIVFNPTANTFSGSPKVTRYIKTLGELENDVLHKPSLFYKPEVLEKILNVRGSIGGYTLDDFNKQAGYTIDGFGSLYEYYQSSYVELLEFEGDIYDRTNNKLLKNRIITVVDRQYVLRDIENPSWIGQDSKTHVGWRTRPDNLYAMGPLDNLVGMQYRMDHIENSKADAMDLTIQPPIKIIGGVEDFVWGPSSEIFIDEGGDVIPMPPNYQALQLNSEIQTYQAQMEEMSGAPKQAAGIRTQGEKTAFEVQTLENNAGRIFQDKVIQFEEQMLEPMLNKMLEEGRRNFDAVDLVKVMDDDVGVEGFIEINKEDITATGKLRPRGAKHFAARAQLVQNLTSFYQSGIGQDPSVSVHISGIATAKLFEEALGLEKYSIVKENIKVEEQLETQRLTQAAQSAVEEEGLIDTAPEQDIEGLDELG